jgi:hypothetical protein
MSPNSDIPSTAVLLIDGSTEQRTYWDAELTRCPPDYEILEASDSQSGLDLYRSRRIDCVALELGSPTSGSLRGSLGSKTTKTVSNTLQLFDRDSPS